MFLLLVTALLLPPETPTLFISISPRGDAIALRALLDDGWHGLIVERDGTTIRRDLGMSIHPIRWSKDGGRLEGVRLVDDGDRMLTAEEVGFTPAGEPAVVATEGDPLAAWEEVYLRGADRPRPAGASTIIAIDPGHGGPGAGKWNGVNGDGAGSHGPNGLTEQWVNLRVADLLFEALAVDPRFVDSFLVRNSQTQAVSLADRVAIAAQGGAALYLSIHHNGLPAGATNRTESYYCRLNGSCPSLEPCRRLARALHDRIVASFGLLPHGAAEDSEGTALYHFYVLHHAAQVAALTEASNLNDAAEEARFGNDPLEHRAKDEAIALHLALVEFLEGAGGVGEREEPPAAIRLDPVVRRGDEATTTLTLESAGRREIEIVDLLGRRIVALDPAIGPTRHHLTWNGRNGASAPVAPGRYWLVVRQGATIEGVRPFLW